MVTPEERPEARRDAHTGRRYVTRSDGAPPLPPPGGYRGARRVPTAAPVAPPQREAPEASAPSRNGPGALGWTSLGVSAAFALVLLSILAFAGADVIYGTTVIALQLVVLAVVVAALAIRRARSLAAVALSLTLLLNVGTIGAVSAMQTTAASADAGAKTDEERRYESYPGIAGEDASTALARPSLEEVRELSDALSAEIREALSDEYGLTWTEAPGEDVRPERNGHGGESMLVRYMSPTWSTNEPVSGTALKTPVMRSIEDVLARSGWWAMWSFNDPASGLDPSILEDLYGGDDIDEQVAWEWYTSDPSNEIVVYATITDLSRDTTGEWRADREADSRRTGEPLEGLQIRFYAERLLSEADRDEFERRMAEFDG
ncbi:hypothetical protein [Microbacterium marinilacus]|uniref:DUF308 domain-containing protein n=1 Tax=Microbacterium marinilacus TaxID=415209 RepID=A0ABP7BTV8_9MICO|nr:hypothetical protein [Microbacterium marinilacus]MBY0688245.1 hypothetical protein [Microbacterium marinilacus]